MLTPEYMKARQTAREALRELERSFIELALDAVISLQGLVVFPVTGSPALTLPVGMDGTEGIPIPPALNDSPFSEEKLFAIGAALEAALGPIIEPPCLSTTDFAKEPKS